MAMHFGYPLVIESLQMDVNTRYEQGLSHHYNLVSLLPAYRYVANLNLSWLLKTQSKVVLVIYISSSIFVQATKTEQDYTQAEMDEKAAENNQDQADGGDESNLSEVGVNGSTVWTNSEIGGGNDTNISVFILCCCIQMTQCSF